MPSIDCPDKIMQLFTIGLWRLNPDGSRILGAQKAVVNKQRNLELSIPQP